MDMQWYCHDLSKVLGSTGCKYSETCMEWPLNYTVCQGRCSFTTGRINMICLRLLGQLWKLCDFTKTCLVSLYKFNCTGKPLYNMIVFLQNTHKRYSIARPCGRITMIWMARMGFQLLLARCGQVGSRWESPPLWGTTWWHLVTECCNTREAWRFPRPRLADCFHSKIVTFLILHVPMHLKWRFLLFFNAENEYDDDWNNKLKHFYIWTGQSLLMTGCMLHNSAFIN